MRNSRLPILRQAFTEFFLFAPKKISLCLVLMLLLGLTTGIGLLLIIPLLQLVGVELASANGHEFIQIISKIFISLNIPLTLPAILTIYILTLSLLAFLRYRLTLLTATIQQSYICTLRDQLFRALIHSHWQFIIQHRMADFVHSLSGQVQSVGQASYQMLNLTCQIILVSVYTVLSLLISWQMSLLALTCAIFLFALLLPFNKRIYQSGQTELVSYKQIFRMLTEQLASLKMIKSYASEQHYAEQLHHIGHTLEQQHIRLTRFNALTRMIYMIGAVITFSLLFYFAVHWLAIPLADLLLLLFIFSRLLPQISSIQSSYQQLLHQLPACNDIWQMQADCQQQGENCPETSTPTPTIQQQLSIKNIDYQYPDKYQPIIKNLSLEIKHNESIALVGASGTGKSTLADLIAGLLVPDQGEILCDQQALTAKNRLLWRATIAYVTQDVYLFHDTIRNNLNWVKANVNEDELWQALTLAAAKDFVQALPKGLDTIIGDSGVRLSGGERQRLALARALLSQPQLLILDEATSALDDDNEKKIQQALKHLQGKLTIIIIAHRQTTIQHVDKIINLEQHMG